MDSFKKKNLESIKNEVDDFHPILQALFTKLPDIRQVDYTHGQNEMGSDFILWKEDKTLNQTHYIGVIAKTGTIKQDHSDVERQIRECGLPRLTDGGTKEIFLNEIWVVSNSNITHAAERKIHHNFSNKNIKFINGTKLIQLIDKYYQDYWFDVSVHVGQYLRSISEQAKNLQTNVSLLNIPDTDAYIDQDLIKIEERRKYDERTRKKQKRIKIDSVLKNTNHIMIQGALGTGKSTLISRIAKEHSSNVLLQFYINK